MKDWRLNNSDNENLLLSESTGSDDGTPFALEFIDYGDGTEYPIDNSLCDIALEQQANDLATTEIGLNVKGIFYPDTDPTNDDGTYQRSIYHQIETMFYNMYLDPSKIWGIENIDFQISQTKRILSDRFRLIDIPRTVYGEKITPKTFVAYDNTLDNSYQIKDDGNGNLFAGTNLFSHQQELGEYVNEFIANMSSSYCDYYWHDNTSPITDYPSMETSFFRGSLDLAPPITDYITGPIMSFVSGQLIDTVVTNSSSFENSSYVVGLFSGSVVDLVITDSSSIDYPYITTNLLTGSLLTTVLPVVASPISGSFPETSQFYTTFFTGSCLVTTFTVTMSFDNTRMMTGFVSGNVI